MAMEALVLCSMGCLQVQLPASLEQQQGNLCGQRNGVNSRKTHVSLKHRGSVGLVCLPRSNCRIHGVQSAGILPAEAGGSGAAFGGVGHCMRRLKPSRHEIGSGNLGNCFQNRLSRDSSTYSSSFLQSDLKWRERVAGSRRKVSRRFVAQAAPSAAEYVSEESVSMGFRRAGESSTSPFSWIRRGFEKAKDAVSHVRAHYKDMLTLNYWIVEDYKKLVEAVNSFEIEMVGLTDQELKDKTPAFRKRLQAGETLEDIQAEAFAVVREAARRTLGMRHFDVQIIGGAILHDGAIAEMKTGEGKTLVSTLPAYLNALTGKGVHAVTVNDYLAKRDAEWMGRIQRSLGLTVGLIQSDLTQEERRAAYACDITYTNNSELGFDFLRDHTCTDREELVLRWPEPFHFAIVDEVDSVLIDEGRNPLLISGQSGKGESKYPVAAEVANQLSAHDRTVSLSDGSMEWYPKDYKADYKDKSVELTEFGVERAEFFLQDYINKEAGDDLWSGSDSWARYIVMALKAKEFYLRDRDYIVREDNVEIVDEFTGRIMPNRRWSDGQHQAVEAKEGLQVKPNMVTVAQITYQSFFQFYSKLAGMTGTAKTEEVELLKIYKTPVVVVPTNMSNIREDLPLQVFTSPEGKWQRIADEVYDLHATGRPVLVGTTSVEQSEVLSDMLTSEGVPHNLLNARPQYAAREAEIVSQAGRLNAVTISTNMAGRGTDIILGGNPEMLAKSLLEQFLLPYISEPEESDEEEPSGPVFEGAVFRPPNESEFWRLLERARTAAKFMGGEEGRMLSAEAGRRLLAAAVELAASGSVEMVDDGRPGAEMMEFLPRVARTYKVLLQECKVHCQKEGAYVKMLGGLHVIGTSLHESRRVDNQLRGRAGRQGDPGSTRFMISAHDDLLARFGSQVTSVTSMLNSLAVYKEYPDYPIENSMVQQMFGQLQRKVEQYYFGLRKQLVEFEEVFEVQRTYLYELRQEMVMEDASARRERLFRWMQAVVDEVVLKYSDPNKPPSMWDITSMLEGFREIVSGDDDEDTAPEDLLPGVTPGVVLEALRQRAPRGTVPSLGAFFPALTLPPPSVRSRAASLKRWGDIASDTSAPDGKHRREVMLLRRYLGEVMIGVYQDRLSRLDPTQQRLMRNAERHIPLQILDQQWQGHLLNMQRLRSAVNVRSFGQMNPLEEYRMDGCRIFIAMLSMARRKIVSELLPLPQQYVVMAQERRAEVA